MTSLIARLEAATEPSRDLDRDIHTSLGLSMATILHHGDRWNCYTSSIDAAVALAERVLSGWRVENLCEWEDEVLRSRGSWTCDLRKNGTDYFSPLKGKCSHAPTPAIALCIAILKAKEASHD